MIIKIKEFGSVDEKHKNNDLPHALPDLDEDVTFILNRPNFVCGPIAHRMRKIGYKCEKSQKKNMHWLYTQCSSSILSTVTNGWMNLISI